MQVSTQIALVGVDIVHANLLQVVNGGPETYGLSNGRRARLKSGGRWRVCAVVQVHMLQQQDAVLQNHLDVQADPECKLVLTMRQACSGSQCSTT
jgi:hypothetical protein